MDTFVGNPWVVEGPTGLIATYIPTMDVKHGEKISITTDKNYDSTAKKDSQAFVNFMTEQRPGGEDIDNWSMADLQQMVQKYKE